MSEEEERILEADRMRSAERKMCDAYVQEVVLSRFSGVSIVNAGLASFEINGRPMCVMLFAQRGLGIFDMAAWDFEPFDILHPDQVVAAINRSLNKPEDPNWKSRYTTMKSATVKK